MLHTYSPGSDCTVCMRTVKNAVLACFRHGPFVPTEIDVSLVPGPVSRLTGSVLVVASSGAVWMYLLPNTTSPNPTAAYLATTSVVYDTVCTLLPSSTVTQHTTARQNDGQRHIFNNSTTARRNG